jgi:hypothetical protein
MRTITLSLYKFDELPTETAKEVARWWWKKLEADGPAWRDEHYKSAYEARKFIESYRMWDGVSGLKKAATDLLANSDGCPWTGYCADNTALDVIIKACDKYSDIPSIQDSVRSAMNEAWETECESAMQNEHVDDCIIANDYEFLENGEKA